MREVAAILLLGNINDRESKRGHMAVFEEDAGPFHFVPMVDGSIRIAHTISRRIIGQSPQGPVPNAIGGGQVVGFAGAPTVDDDVVETAAEPDHRVFQIINRLAVNGVRINMGP